MEGGRRGGGTHVLTERRQGARRTRTWLPEGPGAPPKMWSHIVSFFSTFRKVGDLSP